MDERELRAKAAHYKRMAASMARPLNDLADRCVAWISEIIRSFPRRSHVIR
jgi:hypothetical protein